MTKEEIDKTIAIFTEAKKNGQFRAFWKTFDESVNLMASGEVVIQSMWSPAITAVKSRGIPCVYQPLKEGYRSWGGGLGLSKALTGHRARRGLRVHQLVSLGLGRRLPDAPGLLLGRARDLKEFMSENEWGYWYEGKPATGDIVSPTGDMLGHGRRRARRRLLRRAHGQGRLLELGDGREPVHGPQVERVHRRLT